jgi:hypothetical protein
MIMAPELAWYVFAALCIAALLWNDHATRQRVDLLLFGGTVVLILAALVTEVLSRGGSGVLIALWLTGRVA